MGWVDYTIIGIILLSTLVGIVRGFLREVLSFVIWLVALLVAWTFHKEFAGTLGGWIAGAYPRQELTDQLAPWVTSPHLQIIAAFLILVLGVLPGGDHRPPTFRAPEKEGTYRHRSHPGRRVRCGPGGNPGCNGGVRRVAHTLAGRRLVAAITPYRPLPDLGRAHSGAHSGASDGLVEGPVACAGPGPVKPGDSRK